MDSALGLAELDQDRMQLAPQDARPVKRLAIPRTKQQAGLPLGVVLGTRSPGDVFPQHRCYGRMQVPFPFARIIEASKPLKPGLRDPQYVQRLIDLAQELEDGQDQKRLFQCVKWRSSSPKSSHTQFFWLEGPTAEYRFPPRIMRVRPHAVKGLGCEGANA